MPGHNGTCPHCDGCLCDDCVGLDWNPDEDPCPNCDEWVNESAEPGPTFAGCSIGRLVEWRREARALLLPTLPERPLRLTSLEHEFIEGYQSAAKALADAKLAAFCDVRPDGSVEGEAVFDRLLLDQPSDARALGRGLTVLRALKETHRYRQSLACGLHIHVSAQGLAMRDVESLYHLWNYVEPTLYRLASAGWNEHRSENGNDYAAHLPKGAKGAKRVGEEMSRTRYFGLNLSPYLTAMRSCSCGSYAYGEWASCECVLPKPTAEFRVFNASVRAAKVSAYISLCQGLLTLAQSRTFSPEKHRTLHASEGALFLLRHLPASEPERERLHTLCGEAGFSHESQPYQSLAVRQPSAPYSARKGGWQPRELEAGRVEH